MIMRMLGGCVQVSVASHCVVVLIAEEERARVESRGEGWMEGGRYYRGGGRA